MIHELETLPEPFAAVLRGEKTHEIREDHPRIGVGDVLCLREWNPEWQAFTDRECWVTVTYKTKGGVWGLPPNLCVLSIRRIDPLMRAVYRFRRRWDRPARRVWDRLLPASSVV